ncbi:hypothetical protein Hanom_Chr14g01256281 [Helianthus anomalus]
MGDYKQRVLNHYIDKVAKLKQELAEKEKVVNKLQSYHASSCILECIFNITPDDKDSEKNKKGIGSKIDQVPPTLENNYTFYDDEKVAKVINIFDQLPDNIVVTYAKSDDVGDSEVDKIGIVFKIVEIKKAEIDKFTGKSKKTFYNKPGYKKKNLKSGLGYKRKQNQRKQAEKTNFQKKTNFVHGTSSEEEKELQFSRQTNEEFYAQKKQQQAKDDSKKTCFMSHPFQRRKHEV